MKTIIFRLLADANICAVSQAVVSKGCFVCGRVTGITKEPYTFVTISYARNKLPTQGTVFISSTLTKDNEEFVKEKD